MKKLRNAFLLAALATLITTSIMAQTKASSTIKHRKVPAGYRAPAANVLSLD